MKIIAEITDKIMDEIEDARKYAKNALLQKDTDKTLAGCYATLSRQELSHARSLHDEAKRLINDYRASHGEPPEGMMAVYNYKHKDAIEKEADVRRMLDMYDAT